LNRGTPPESDKATLEDLASKQGVRLSSQEADAVIQTLARVHRAAATLLHARPFDTTIEQFYRLLEDDAAADGGG
jgi:hypothetical protein